MKIRTLIVDDEPLGRAKVLRCLASEPDVEVIGEEASGDRAIEAIGGQRPDLVFLDVQMPAPNGIEVLRAVRDEWLPCTIFTTAHAEHAVAAFELHAIDYLLKPYTERRLAAAVERARARLRQGASGADMRIDAWLRKTERSQGPLGRFLVKTNDRYVVVLAADIIWAESAANYVILHTPAGNHVLRRTLAQLESELDARRFFRASRSAIVNLDAVRDVQIVAEGEHLLRLTDGSQVPLTRGLREFQQKLQLPG